jgi:ubiquitin C-terminal hydrolase
MSTNINPVGFRNLGNTCYMNSALQALLASNVLNSLILIYIQKNPNSIKRLSPMTIEYCRILTDLMDKKNRNKIYTPMNFKMKLGMNNVLFRGNRQHDSNELLLYLINEFCEGDKTFSKMIKKTCYGKYKQYIRCKECNYEQEDYFDFLDVLLPIPTSKKKNPDLEDCFKEFANTETLDNTNKWYCPKCKVKVSAYKKMEIEEVPDVLIITLSRFNNMQKNNTPIKIYKNICLENKKLKLVSTINHYGGVRGGHYTASVINNDKWFLANDERISSLDINKCINGSFVYVCIYECIE